MSEVSGTINDVERISDSISGSVEREVRSVNQIDGVLKQALEDVQKVVGEFRRVNDATKAVQKSVSDSFAELRLVIERRNFQNDTELDSAESNAAEPESCDVSEGLTPASAG